MIPLERTHIATLLRAPLSRSIPDNPRDTNPGPRAGISQSVLLYTKPETNRDKGSMVLAFDSLCIAPALYFLRLVHASPLLCHTTNCLRRPLSQSLKLHVPSSLLTPSAPRAPRRCVLLSNMHLKSIATAISGGQMSPKEDPSMRRC